MKSIIETIKPYAYSVGTWLQRMDERRYPQATLLHRFPRLLQLARYSCGAQCAATSYRVFTFHI